MMKKFHNLTFSLCVLMLAGISLTTSALETAHESTQAESMVIEESDFQQLSREMEQKSLGLLLMFHAEHCPYCALMEKEILSPMLKSGDYTDKVIIRKLQLDASREIKNFKGETVKPSDVAARYNVMLTPTLVFLDKDGNQKAKKMVGINTVDYFGAYLDEEIEKLRKNLAEKQK